MAKKKYAGRSNPSPTRRILNVLPSKNTENDWGFLNAVDSGVLGVPAALPATKDLRESWWTIGDQGNTDHASDGRPPIRSCDGISSKPVALAKAICWRCASSGWPRRKPTNSSASRPPSLKRTAPVSKAALDIARKYGAVLDKVLPFNRKTVSRCCKNLLRARCAAEDRQLLQSATKSGQLADMDRDAGADSHAAGRG